MPPMTPELRAFFEARVERIPFDTCWHWMGVRSKRGDYGIVDIYGQPRMQYRAHRIAWELYRGPLPTTHTIDHLCKVHSCVNPAHLEVVTQKTNVLRGEGPTAENARKIACLRGHPFTPENTWVFVGADGYKRRACRECQRMHGREYANRVKPWIAARARWRLARLQKEEFSDRG